MDCPIRHLGTEKAHDLYLKIQKHLIENGVELHMLTDVDNLIIKDGVCYGATAGGKEYPSVPRKTGPG